MTVDSTEDKSGLPNLEVASLKDAGIALLIDLAQQGEIDPWDVQVIDVIDRFLSHLALSESAAPDRREAGLSQSGQAFVWASMLVLLKANTLEREQIVDPEGETTAEDDLEANDWESEALPARLERHLRRRPAVIPLPRRPVTLAELIEQLQQIAATWEEKPPSPPKVKRPRNLSATEAARTVESLAHQEDLTQIARELDNFLSERWSELVAGQEWLSLDRLLEFWVRDDGSEKSSQIEVRDAHASPLGDRVGAFWALLLLSAQSKVELSQEEFYQDIRIRWLNGEL
ncbi:MAG: segregation/condensation protein A [Cyanosarcina radialis HA8281-LM2]|nr:segregation/condensation protein A [Cyanosarcina radialis HA8281-LM2]